MHFDIEANAIVTSKENVKDSLVKAFVPSYTNFASTN